MKLTENKPVVPETTYVLELTGSELRLLRVFAAYYSTNTSNSLAIAAQRFHTKVVNLDLPHNNEAAFV